MDMLKRCEAVIRGRGLAVVLPEGEDDRILKAALLLQAQGLARPVVLGVRSEVGQRIAALGLDATGLVIRDPVRDSAVERLATLCAEGRKRMTPGVALRLMQKPLYFGGMLVKAGEADAMVAGAANPTRRIIEAGQMTVGLAQGITTPSSCFLMIVPPQGADPERALVFADCAVNADPSPDELADIAMASAASCQRLLREEPRVALLSFSTHGSARHPHVEKVETALEILRRRAPSLAVDGALQADAALSETVARKKVKQASEVAGRANVLIFPDLDAGNIGYKLTQYLGGARAYGPFLQGFARPVSDLSRGASVEEIVATAVIALAQSDKALA